jgi:glycerate 2-kinase
LFQPGIASVLEDATTPTSVSDRILLKAMFDAAVAAASPWDHIGKFLPPPPMGRTIIVGAGKASAQMARAVDDIWTGSLEGLVITGSGQSIDCPRISTRLASHPVPDVRGQHATQLLLEHLAGLTQDDLVIALISGGGSAMMPAPAAGLTLADEQAINRALLACGAPIHVMNLIRNQFSLVKGGRLALAAYPARVVTLVLSDIPGDEPSLVASGPTIPMGGSREQARQVAKLYNVDLPAAAATLLRSDRNLAPLADDDRFARNEVYIVASASVSLKAAAAEAERMGLATQILSSSMEGEASVVGTVQASLIREIRQYRRPFRGPVAILSGGETTVTLKGKGRGGRNAEFLLALAIGIDGLEGISALAADTDGRDGSETNAGAFADGTTVSRMRQRGIDPTAWLLNNDAYSAFEAIGDLLFTGPTGTNVNDFRAILVR